MSFWGGMARGFKDASEKKERDKAVELQKERLAIQDARYESETARAERYRSEDVAFRTQEFMTRQEQIAFDRKMAERADTRAQESVYIDRQLALIEIMPPGLASSLGGGTPSKGGSKGGSTVMSAEAITEGATMYHNEYQNLSEEQKDSEFFKKLKGDAGTQASMMAFITAQAQKGNTVTLGDLPKYFKYVGTIEGQGEAEAQKALEMLTTGEGITDAKSFAKGLVAFKNFKPTKHLFQQTGTPANLEDLDKQMSFWETATETEAFRSLSGLPDGKKEETQQALAMLEQKATRVQGLSKLAELGFGRAAAEKHNLLDNSVIGSYYTSEEAPVAGTNTGAAPGGGVTPPKAPVEPPKSPVEGQVFGSWAEVEEARNNGFSGVATVGGTAYNIAPVEPVEGPDGLTQSSVKPEGGVDEAGFNVSDTSLQPVPELDALFESVMTEGAQPKTEIPDNRPIREPQTIEEIEGGIEGALEGEALDEKVAAVEEELFELGVYKPTNKQELQYFKEDLNVLISDLEIQIPPEVLKGVVEKVIADVTYKAEGPKDYTRPESKDEEEEEAAMDWSNRRGRILDTPDDELDARARRNTGRSR